MIKKILTGLAAIGLTFGLEAASLSYNTTTNGGVYILSTNRASVYQIEVTAGNAALLNFYDCDTLTQPVFGTNYTNAAYVSRTTYATNLVTSFVGYNGYTNWYTNLGVFTINVTNAIATNHLPLLFSAVVAANTYAVYNVDALFVRGIALEVPTGTNISVVVNYRSGQ